VNFHQEINDHSDAQDIQKLAQANLIRRAVKSLKRGIPPSVFRVGDRCRINIFKLSNSLRRIVHINGMMVAMIIERR
jgi:hypothetical protein